ncbi:MAG: class I SAM-dependent methyltransferase [Polyangiaceae bacterium]|jgi:SAM-dependent methyltransferase
MPIRTEAHLERSFGRAATKHYAWQTEHPYVARRERELVHSAFMPLGSRVLDVGCGEGATLRHLGEPEGATGIDLFEEKIAFAQITLPRCRFVVGSVYELPFEDRAFDHIVVRDLVHHLDEPERFVAECARVLVPGGRIDVLEPSRGNPLVVAHALALPVERGELRSTMHFLTRLLVPRFRVVSQSRYQAMPIHRIVFHPDFGRPRLAEHGGVRALVAACERLATRWLPRVLWAYLHVRAVSNAA